MTYTVISRNRRPTVTKSISINRRGRIYCNAVLSEVMRHMDIEHIYLCHDAERKRIGILKAPKPDQHTWKIVSAQKKNPSFVIEAKIFLDAIDFDYEGKVQTFPVVWNNDLHLFEIELMPPAIPKITASRGKDPA